MSEYKCCLCKCDLDGSSAYEYRGFVSCEEHFEEVIKKVDIRRSEVISRNEAAENAGLKAASFDEIEVINRGGQAYCVKDGMSVNSIYARGWNDYRAKSLSVETPATDVFLAEVRAQGVEQLALHMELNGYSNEAAGAREYATQLRKGVQS